MSFLQKIVLGGLACVAVSGSAREAIAAGGAKEAAGKILLVKGQVFILDAKSHVVADPEGKRGRSTQPGQPFYVGETIQTRADGRVKVQFKEGGNEVVLGAETSLLVERATTSAQAQPGTTLSLARGEVRSTVKQKYSGDGKNVYEVKTQNAVAGVRGTIFTVRFDPSTLHSEFATEQGAVRVTNLLRGASEGVLVRPGMFTSSQGATLAAPAPLAQNPELMNHVERLAHDDLSVKNNKGSGDKPEAGMTRMGPSSPAEGATADAASGAGGSKADVAPLGHEPFDEKSGRSPASGTLGDTNSQPPPPPRPYIGEDSRTRAYDAVKRSFDGAQQAGTSQTQQNIQRGSVIINIQ